MSAILLLGTLARLYRIDAESIWLDEATSILLAKLPLIDMIRTTAQDVHPPLYYGLLHLWGALGDTEFAARSLSAVVGILTIPVIFQLGMRLWGRQAGLAAALLLATSPLHIWYSQETRMYGLVTLFALTGSLLLWRALTNHRPADWTAYAIAMALALYTHYHAIYVLLFHNLYLGGRWLSDGRKSELLRPWLLSMAGIAGAFAPWVPVVARQISGGGGSWVSRAIGAPSFTALLGTIIDYSIGSAWDYLPVALRRASYFAFGLVLAAGAVAAARAGDAQRKRGYAFAALYLVVPLGAIWLISQAMPMYARRYLLPFLPPYLLLLAAGIAALPTRSLRAVGAIALAGISLWGTVLMARYPQKDDWRAAAALVMERAQPDDVVAFDPMWDYKPFDYYARGALDLYTELPVPIPAGADVASLLKGAVEGSDRLWLIWQVDHYADPEGWVQRYLDETYARAFGTTIDGVGQISLYELSEPAAP